MTSSASPHFSQPLNCSFPVQSAFSTARNSDCSAEHKNPIKRTERPIEWPIPGTALSTHTSLLSSLLHKAMPIPPLRHSFLIKESIVYNYFNLSCLEAKGRPQFAAEFLQSRGKIASSEFVG